MNLSKNKNSHIEMLLLAIMEELKEQLHYEMEEALVRKVSRLTAKVNAIEERTFEDLLSIKDAAGFLGVSKATLWRLRKSGEIKTYMLGSQVYFKKSEILKSLIPLN